MDVNYETDTSVSHRSLETENYDSSTVQYYEYNRRELVTQISHGTDNLETYLPDWRENFWDLFDERYLNYNLGWTITIVIVYALIFFIGLVGNWMVILVVINRPRMRTVTNLFIMNLAVADLLVILFCVPTELLFKIFRPWILGSLGCKGANYMTWVSLCASAYSLAAIALDRCQAIYRLQVPPRGFSKRQAIFAICLIWTIALTLTVPLAKALVVQDDDLFPICTQVWENELFKKIYFLVVFLFLFYCWPLILIFVSNIIVLSNVSKRKTPEDCALSFRAERMHRKSRQSVGKMLGIVTLLFLLSWLPFYVFQIHRFLLKKHVDPNLKEFLRTLLPLLYSSNSSINPVLYAFMSRKFRDSFKSLLPKWLPCIHREEYNCETSWSSRRETIINDILP